MIFLCTLLHNYHHPYDMYTWMTISHLHKHVLTNALKRESVSFCSRLRYTEHRQLYHCTKQPCSAPECLAQTLCIDPFTHKTLCRTCFTALLITKTDIKKRYKLIDPQMRCLDRVLLRSLYGVKTMFIQREIVVLWMYTHEPPVIPRAKKNREMQLYRLFQSCEYDNKETLKNIPFCLKYWNSGHIGIRRFKQIWNVCFPLFLRLYALLNPIQQDSNNVYWYLQTKHHPLFYLNHLLLKTYDEDLNSEDFDFNTVFIDFQAYINGYHLRNFYKQWLKPTAL